MELPEKKVYVRAILITLLCSLTLYFMDQLGAKQGKYAIGDRGPGGGIVFYDKGNNSNGWRYIEAAPETAGRAEWGCYRNSRGGTKGDAIGTGRDNTLNHVKNCSDRNFAAKMAVSYKGGGMKDWFLPSKDELELLYKTLFDTGLLKHENHHYWSSTSYSMHYAWNIATYDSCKGNQYYWGKYNAFFVHPIRYFSD